MTSYYAGTGSWLVMMVEGRQEYVAGLVVERLKTPIVEDQQLNLSARSLPRLCRCLTKLAELGRIIFMKRFVVSFSQSAAGPYRAPFDYYLFPRTRLLFIVEALKTSFLTRVLSTYCVPRDLPQCHEHSP